MRKRHDIFFRGQPVGEMRSRMQVTDRSALLIPSPEPLITAFKLRGSRFKGFKGFKGFWWRLRRILDDGILVSSAFPSRGRCPEGADRALAV